MKVLFSTKYLAYQLKRALKNKGFDTILFGANEWILYRPDKLNLTLSVEHCTGSHNDIDSLKIDRAQWYKLMKFVENLPEQPIVLELSNYGNDDINIRLSQFIADF